jgi:hypothetical protein
MLPERCYDHLICLPYMISILRLIGEQGPWPFLSFRCLPLPPKLQKLKPRHLNTQCTPNLQKTKKTECFLPYHSELRPSSSVHTEEASECCSIDVLQEFLSVFPAELPRNLPSKRSVDHHIDLLPNSRPVVRASYCLSSFEQEEVRRRMKNFDSVLTIELWTSKLSGTTS